MQTTQAPPSTLHVDRKHLLTALQRVGAVIPSHACKPILSGVRLDATGGRLRLSATNPEINLAVSIDADGELAACLVKHLDLVQRIKSGRTDVCTLTLDPARNSLIVNGGSVEHRLPLLELSEYAPVPAQPRGVEWRVNAAQFRNALAIALRAAARESGRYAIDGVLLSVDQTGARVVATDGRRLVMVDVEQHDGPFRGAVILPRAVATLIGKLVDRRSTDVVTVFVKVNSDAKGNKEPADVSVVGPNWMLTGQEVDGQFPRYKDVIPWSQSRFIVEREALLDTLTAVAGAADEERKGVRLDLAADSIRVSAGGSGSAASSGVVPAEFAGGGDDRVIGGFTPMFLRDALQSLPDDQAVIDVGPNRQGRTDPCVLGRPALIYGHDPARANPAGRIRWVIMPIALDTTPSGEIGASHVPSGAAESDSAVADSTDAAATPSVPPTMSEPTLASPATTVTPPRLSADASVAAPAVLSRSRNRVEHTWPPIGTVLEGTYVDQTHAALVIAAPKLKSGRAVQVITGPATGQVFKTMTAAMLGATAKQLGKRGPGTHKKNLPASGWDFWRAAAAQRASA